MKKLVILAAFVAAPFFAHAGQHLGADDYPVTGTGNATCVNGSTEIFLEGLEETTPVYYTCKNGSYVRRYSATKMAKIGLTACKEGTKQTFLEGTESTTPVRYTCHNGRFVRH